MKDSSDMTTSDLFPVVKKRGRPATGNAKTSAERQAAYRLKKSQPWEGDQSNLNVWVDSVSKQSLERMARHDGLSVSQVLDKIIRNAELELLNSLGGHSAEYWNIS